MSENKKPKEGYYSTLTGARRCVPIVLFACALFVGVCFITKSVGALGEGISSLLLGLFSFGAYAIPPLLVIHAIFYAEDYTKKRTVSRVIFSLLTVILISAIEYAIVFWGQEYPFSPAEFYNTKSAGGLVGSTVAFGLVQFLGSLGVIILALALIAVYVTFFFANSRSAFSRVVLAILGGIVGVLCAIERFFKSLFKGVGAKKKERKAKESEKKNKDFLDDPFFTSDAGLNEIKIAELGIHKKIDADGKIPPLQKTVVHKSQVDEPVKEAPRAEGERKPTGGVDFSYGNTVTDKVVEPNKAHVVGEEVQKGQRDSSAASIFTKDFDPFDFMVSEKEASRPSSRYVPKEEAKKDTPITEISYEDVQRARREEEFARRKAELIRMREQAAKAPESEPVAKCEPTVTVATKSDESGVSKTVEFKVEAPKAQATEQPPRQGAEVHKSYEKPEAEANPYADYILKKVADANPAYTPSFNDTKTYVSVTDTTKAPEVEEKPTEPVFKPYTVDSGDEKTEPCKVEEESDSGLKIDRMSINLDISPENEPTPVEAKDDVPTPTYEEIAPQGDEDEDTPDTSFIDFDEDEEDDEEPSVEFSEEDEEEEDAVEIPPEEQNPDVIEMRKMFPFMVDDDEEAEEEPEEVEEEDEEPAREPAAPTPKAGELSLVSAADAKRETKKNEYKNYQFPPIELLGLDADYDGGDIEAEHQANADKLIETLASFNITASIKGVDRGPRITRYEVVPSKGIKVSSVMNLENDIALALAADGIRMEAPIPGKSAIGIEIPNKTPVNVRLRELLETEDFKTNRSKTAVCIGKDVAGQPIINDISKMPHLLIAGATGMGKSVCINSLMISMLYKARPDEVKFIMIDPKQVEFTMYTGIPHLLVPVVSDAKKAAGALMWAVEEMERRFGQLNTLCVRNIDAYNEKIERDKSLGEPMSKIVIVIDEFADLMLQVKDPVENLVMRIAQKARAAGIHLIIGTQRPAVNVITGTIKANIPSRISCKVASNIDSRTVLDSSGAEKLLNKGDMLFAYSGAIKPLRVQGAFVTDDEVAAITDHLKKFATGNDYDTSVMEEIERAAQRCNKKGGGDADDDRADSSGEGYLNDKQFLDSVELAVNTGKISTSLIQRKISVGYGKAAKFIDIMEDMGIVGEANGQKPREVLITADEWREKLARTMLD